MNNVARGVFWCGRGGVSAQQAYGQASGAIMLLRSSQKQLLYRSIPWRPLLAGWPEAERQHDAAEFFFFPHGTSAAGGLGGRLAIST